MRIHPLTPPSSHTHTHTHTQFVSRYHPGELAVFLEQLVSLRSFLERNPKLFATASEKLRWASLWLDRCWHILNLRPCSVDSLFPDTHPHPIQTTASKFLLNYHTRNIINWQQPSRPRHNLGWTSDCLMHLSARYSMAHPHLLNSLLVVENNNGDLMVT